MADFTINKSREIGRATLIGETREASAWMAKTGISCNYINDRAISYVDDKHAAVLKKALEDEGFSCVVRDV